MLLACPDPSSHAGRLPFGVSWGACVLARLGGFEGIWACLFGEGGVLLSNKGRSVCLIEIWLLCTVAEEHRFLLQRAFRICVCLEKDVNLNRTVLFGIEALSEPHPSHSSTGRRTYASCFGSGSSKTPGGREMALVEMAQVREI